MVCSRRSCLCSVYIAALIRIPSESLGIVIFIAFYQNYFMQRFPHHFLRAFPLILVIQTRLFILIFVKVVIVFIVFIVTFVAVCTQNYVLLAISNVHISYLVFESNMMLFRSFLNFRSFSILSFMKNIWLKLIVLFKIKLIIIDVIQSLLLSAIVKIKLLFCIG